MCLNIKKYLPAHQNNSVRDLKHKHCFFQVIHSCVGAAWCFVLSCSLLFLHPAVFISGQRGCFASCEKQTVRGAVGEGAHLGGQAGVGGDRTGLGAPQQPQEAPAEVLPHEAVQDGVDAGVEVGDADGERHGRVDDIQSVAVADHIEMQQQVHEVEDLVRGPAEEEGQHGRRQHVEHLVAVAPVAPLDAFWPLQRPADQAVAGEDDDEWDDEPQDALHQAEGHQPPVGFVAGDGADGDVGALDGDGAAREGGGEAEQERHRPDQDARHLGVAHRAVAAGFHWAHNGQVAVDAKCGEEEDAGVEVKGDQGGRGLAQEAAEGPVVAHGCDGGPHGQSDEEREIRHGQVQHKYVSHSLHLHVVVDYSHHHAVAHDANDKVTTVHNWDESGDEGVSARHVAYERKFV